MVYKVFEEFGDFIRLSDNKRVNVLIANEAHTPEGLNVGWTSFEPAMTLEAEVHIEEMIPGFIYAPLTEPEKIAYERQQQLLREKQPEVLI